MVVGAAVYAGLTLALGCEEVTRVRSLIAARSR